jgi:hypothetical protein
MNSQNMDDQLQKIAELKAAAELVSSIVTSDDYLELKAENEANEEVGGMVLVALVLTQMNTKLKEEKDELRQEVEGLKKIIQETVPFIHFENPSSEED